MKTMFRKTYLEVILQRFFLESDGVLVLRDFGLRGVRESLSEGKESVLKTCHICLIKLKTRVFHELGSSETVARMATEAQKLSREVVSRK